MSSIPQARRRSRNGQDQTKQVGLGSFLFRPNFKADGEPFARVLYSPFVPSSSPNQIARNPRILLALTTPSYRSGPEPTQGSSGQRSGMRLAYSCTCRKGTKSASHFITNVTLDRNIRSLVAGRAETSPRLPLLLARTAGEMSPTSRSHRPMKSMGLAERNH